MAVGETEEERRKARLASIKTKVSHTILLCLKYIILLQVNYIFEIENSIPFLRKFSFIDTTVRPPVHTKLDDITEKEFQDRNNAVIEEIKVYMTLYYCIAELKGETFKGSCSMQNTVYIC